jgi:hypothetical protein
MLIGLVITAVIGLAVWAGLDKGTNTSMQSTVKHMTEATK